MGIFYLENIALHQSNFVDDYNWNLVSVARWKLALNVTFWLQKLSTETFFQCDTDSLEILLVEIKPGW